jgi:hypothetical protein
MERKTQFESGEDVKAYFANQTELWHDPKPQPPDHLWQRIEQARLLNLNQPPKSNHAIARPDFSRLEFPKIGRQRRPHKVKSVSKIAKVPRISALPQKRYKLKKVSSLRGLFFHDGTRLDET